MTGTATLTVTLSDINDNAPVLARNYQPVVEPNAPVGTSVVTVQASDPDTAAASGKPFRFSTSCAADNKACEAFTLTENSGQPCYLNLFL